MRNDLIDVGAGVPVLPDLKDHIGAGSDPFAFARRLQTAIWVFDIDHTCILYANAAACALWQADDELALRRRDLASDMTPTVAKRLKQYQTDFIERDASFNEMWTLYPMGQPKNTMVVFSGMYLPDGRMAMLCEAVGDAADEPGNLRSTEALLHTDVMISLYELNGPPLYMNPAARNVAAQSQHGLSDKLVDPTAYATLRDALELSGQHRMVTKVYTAAGPRWHDLSAKKCLDAVTGKPVILETAIDVSELKIAKDKARYLADRDQLTGCYNRTFLAQYIEMLAESPEKQCAILSLDIDHFKQINDGFGHEMGDSVLQEIVARARGVIRKDDIIIRLGGDEFVVVLEGVSSNADFSQRIETLRERMTEPMEFDATRINVTVSVGATTFTSSNVDFTSIMREADIALYASKQGGRNRVMFFDEAMGAAQKKRISFEEELKSAIENKEFILHFQPRTDLVSGQVVSAEALVRWQHPNRGLIMPGDFIPICEETGMIEDLGQLVLEMGFKQLIDWDAQGLDIGLSINISPRQFEDKLLLCALENFAQDFGCLSERIELEITESVLIGDLDEIEKKLRVISQMGYRIAIDDFGTGYSNLSYISQFPLDCLKIDQSFINQLPKTGPIISLILTLANQIKADVVAEGIETAEQLDWLSQHGCEQGQGYFLSRPVAREGFMQAVGRLNAQA